MSEPQLGILAGAVPPGAASLISQLDIVAHTADAHEWIEARLPEVRRLKAAEIVANQIASHRIVLLSAALGNRNHIAAWMNLGGEPAQTFHHDWRGPRRAHAIIGTMADWAKAQQIPPTRRNGLTRQSVPLYGQLHIRTAPGRQSNLVTTDPIGMLVRIQRSGGWEKDSQSSDPNYRMRARMVTALGSQGSVLVIEPTKMMAQRMARAIADDIQLEDQECHRLATLAATRLRPQHPLVDVIRHGVGFHHSALPDDIQAELEDAIRNGPLRYLVATTTLIEGINFPVRTVLIGGLGYQDSRHFVRTLDAPKLLNALGRAGRAGRETEGWVALWIDRAFAPQDFDIFAADDQELAAISHLSTANALEALAAFEEALRLGEDAVIEAAGPVADFISHVWFVAAGLSDLQLPLTGRAWASLQSSLA